MLQNEISQLLFEYFPEDASVKKLKEAHQMITQVFEEADNSSARNIYRPKLEDVK